MAGDGTNSASTRSNLRINPPVFFISAALILGFAAFGGLFPETAGAIFPGMLAWITDKFGWFYVLSVAVFLVFVVWLAFSPYGGIRLGPDDSRPDYSYASWFAMLFSAGMGIGLVFFSVAEPLAHFDSPPVGGGGTVDAARQAMITTFFHWGIHAWAIYIVVGLALAYFSFRHNLPLTIRSALFPLLGNRIYGPLGNAVDIFAVLGTMFGVATSLGLGVMQVNAGLNYLFDVPQTDTVRVLLIAGITGAATISVVSGLDGGIKRISELNLILALVLLIFVLVAGPTFDLLRAFAQNIGAYLGALPDITFRLFAYQPQDGDARAWSSGWTLFYWAWWIAWSPFVGMFIARISRGRTIREFILSVMFVPAGFTFLWLTVFGNTGLWMELTDVADLAGGETAVLLFSMLENLPWSAITSLIATTLVVTFFVTSSDSGSLVIDMITSGGDPDPPVWQRVFWAVTEGVVAAALLVAGGLQALQAASIAAALPFTAVMLIICVGLYQGLRLDGATRIGQGESPAPLPIQGASVPWQQRLATIIRRYKRADALRFLNETVTPALEQVAEEIRQTHLDAQVSQEDERITLTVSHGTQTDFLYTVEVRGYRTPSFSPEIPRDTNGEHRHYRAEVRLITGPAGYDIMGYTKDQIIGDLLAHYQTHMEFIHVHAAPDG